MKVSDFDYHLPPGLIAQYPAPQRESSRLLVLRRETGEIAHTIFSAIPEYFEPGDVLVLNETKVFPARLIGKRAGTGGRFEVVLLEEKEPGIWEALVRPGRRARPGVRLIFGEGELQAEIGDRTEAGGRVLKFSPSPDFWEKIFQVGEVPLPPYIKRKPEEIDRTRYQTVYARTLGSVAAPTAGLHFTPELLHEIEQKGVHFAFTLLHVGLGTFRPVKVEEVEEHQMHAEYWRLEETAANLINEALRSGKRVIAVGTTVARVLESAAAAGGCVKPGEGWTRLFIYPGYRFRIIDGLITNFHLPRSTLLMLICAFAGRERVLRAYREAVARRYRFFSYGDAMLII
ncbi:MAG: tRNA preQ1(34) S-adenosylmethionine ribosyltransferase-isomerase QueA [Bacillota bacterium]|nr:tRNA preQ1(34) S-adenosylmethionine ribosyltransferase-isomerase QueA [Bacillota bacterium]